MLWALIQLENAMELGVRLHCLFLVDRLFVIDRMRLRMMNINTPSITPSLLFVFALLCCLFTAPNAQQAPSHFTVTFATTKGNLTLNVTREWSPFGVDRFYDLLQSGYFNDNAFFRVIDKPHPFVAQFGINGEPSVSKKWENADIPNDPVVQSNLRGFVSFAAEESQNGTTCCRTTQLFINYGNNSFLDPMGFSPFAYVTEGMEYADQFFAGYGEEPDQQKIYTIGNNYLKKNFPKLDYLLTAVINSEN
eukprot:TRINITY_DN1767_c0_g1_i1.p1 TRINITY_DN1767_c0_g1~~TRINITY_DN1767_c0_g1_i1.p1  ORF type:complete len:249 (-),score=51.03 TRINITY_DN1767_c0_g1_i1:26-772(-)